MGILKPLGPCMIGKAHEPVDEEDVSDLLPCPFCGAGDTRISASYLPPRMESPGALISVEIRHWCTSRQPGAIVHSRTVRARDRAAAMTEWNRRGA
jgi:hypothetical protein